MADHRQALTDIQTSTQALRQRLADHLAEGTMDLDRDDVEWLNVVLNLLDCAETDLGVVIGHLQG